MSIEIVVVGGSWGGFDAASRLLADLPTSTPVPIVVALHRSSRSKDGALERMISQSTRLRVIAVEDKLSLEPGCVYLAPADYHLLVEDGSLALSTHEFVHFARPSIDVLFESAAEEYRDGVVGVLLTGSNADGAAGMLRIKALGGTTMAQDPATAARPAMPQAAIDTGAVDVVAPVDGLAAELALLLGVAARR